jgi:hypothetical protein
MAVTSYKAVLAHFNAAPAEVRAYFLHLPTLVQSFPWEVLMAYQFILVERGQNRALFGAAMKLHRADGTVAESTIEALHITRGSFLKHYETIVGAALPLPTVNKLKFAERVRDKTVHGKSVSVSDYRQAVVDVVDYAVELNAHIYGIAGFRPFGDMRGFVGSRQSLDKKTTSWLMKGLLSL